MEERRSETSINDVLDRLIKEAETAVPANAPSSGGDIPPAEVIGKEGGGAPLNGLLSGLASNPALLSAIPQLLKGLGGLSAGGGEGKPVAVVKSHTLDRHTALLCALKPYLGASRQHAAEYLINLCRVWGTLQGMGLNLPALLMPAQSSADTHETGEG